MKKLLEFQAELTRNNNREWFHANKERYDQTQAELKALVAQVEEGLSRKDVIDTSKTRIFRLNRDVRFSNNKDPYTKHRSAFFTRLGAERRGGYYLRIENGESRIAGGFFGPEPGDLLHIRKQIQQEPDVLREILHTPELKAYFGELQGDQVKTAPKGFQKEDPAIDLIRYKQFMLRHSFTDKEVASANFTEMVISGFEKMRPFLDYMTEILTTDLNGENLLME